MSEIKLYFCEATAVKEDPMGIIAAENAEEAINKFEKSLDEEGIWHTGTLSAGLIQVDGYTITVTKNKEATQ